MFEELLFQRVKKLIALCAAHHIGITTIESCTGGLLSALLTSTPGSSSVIHSNIVTYHNDAKIRYVGVDPQTLRAYGAVSEETAREMALGGVQALTPFEAFSHIISLSITGVAGPDGGTKDKPVGTVCFGCAVGDMVHSTTYHFDGFRDQVRMHAVRQAIRLIEQEIKKIEQS